MSEHKPLEFKETPTGWLSVINKHGHHCGVLQKDIKGEYLYDGFTSDRLLEIAIKIEDLNNAKAHTERES